jgi:hypothetical protein
MTGTVYLYRTKEDGLRKIRELKGRGIFDQANGQLTDGTYYTYMGPACDIPRHPNHPPSKLPMLIAQWCQDYVAGNHVAGYTVIDGENSIIWSTPQGIAQVWFYVDAELAEQVLNSFGFDDKISSWVNGGLHYHLRVSSNHMLKKETRANAIELSRIHGGR